jgi:hypothetical protein
MGGGLRIRVAQPFNRVEHGICVGHLWTLSLFRLLGCAGRPILSKAAALFFLGSSSRRSALRKFVFGQAPQVTIGFLSNDGERRKHALLLGALLFTVSTILQLAATFAVPN